jgi:hypothetical protein
VSAARTSRRRFIGATGIALSAPLAGLGAEVVGAATGTGPSPDDIDAIRALMHEHAAQLNARPDGFGSSERIDVAADGRSATAALPCVMETETAIGPECPLVDMARQQGGGVVRRTERGILECACVKRDEVWTMQQAGYHRSVTG